MMSGNDVLHVVIKSRKKTLFEGPAKSVTSYNGKGVFDILPSHANFISLVKDKILIVKEDGALVELEVGKGVLRVSLDAVEVYLDISETTTSTNKSLGSKK